MTTTLQAVPRQRHLPMEDIKRTAREAPGPGRVLMTAIAGLFFGIGWVIGGIWRGLAFCGASARYGYWNGRGLTDEEIMTRAEAIRAARHPAPSVPQAAPSRA
jgi:hypothetical protein